jgi:hypothetical protein
VFLEALVDLVGGQSEAVGGVEADKLGGFSEPRAVKLDVDTKDGASLAV